MYTDGKIWIAQSDRNLYLYPAMANRHGLIAGATGTGKTVTMKVLAESFSDMGVPVFFSDVKGDLTGTAVPGADTEDMRRRIERFGIEGFTFGGYPVCLWDLFGEKGHPVRVTISSLGPTLLARLLNLTEIQAGVLNVVFRVADDNGLLLLDLKDLRAMLAYVAENRQEFTLTYGNVSAASVGAIQRALLAFEEEGGKDVFGEPELDIRDWMRTDEDGRGYVNILSSSRLIRSPTVYATFLLWMLTELYEKLPEVGDLEKPKMIFFFDEAHLLFDGAPRALLQKIVQVVKLIRSKAVGVYFVTQSPSDVPGEVLAQLSNRIQHALRAYTPQELKSVRAAAQAFRANPELDAESALLELGVGEALVSCLDEKGVPSVVERARILPPRSLMGAADPALVEELSRAGEMEEKYRESVDSESAWEIIGKAREELETQKREEAEALQKEKEEAAARKAEEKEAAAAQRAADKKRAARTKTAERAASSAASSVARSLSTNLVNTVTGGKTASAGTIAKRAASTALSSVMRSGARGIVRGLFGNKR